MSLVARTTRGVRRTRPRSARAVRLRPAELSFQPLTPARWPDAEALFGPRGACAGCWCMWPRLTAAEFARGKGAGNRRALRGVVRSGDPPGILAYRNGVAIAWCAVAPRPVYRRLERSRVLSPVDDRPVWSVVCFFIARAYRHQGLTARLLRAACDYAARRGARILEGYPVEPAGMTADAFAWTGLASAFRRAGFTEVARRSATRPIMRRELRAPATRARSGRRAASSRSAGGTVRLRRRG